MIAAATKPKENVFGAAGPGTTCSFDGIREPGAYVCRWSGHLLRMSEGSLNPAGTPRITVTGQQPLMVTKIDDDPHVPPRTARLQAANHDVPVNF